MNFAQRDYKGATVFHLLAELQASRVRYLQTRRLSFLKDKPGWNPVLDKIEHFLLSMDGASEAAQLALEDEAISVPKDTPIQAVRYTTRD